MSKSGATREHVVTRWNDHYYRCEVCGQAGSERWAILHQYPVKQTRGH